MNAQEQDFRILLQLENRRLLLLRDYTSQLPPRDIVREVISEYVLNSPERADWRTCTLSKDEEMKLAEEMSDRQT